MLEFERKCLLTKKEYERLCRVFNDTPSVIQVNYYYDTEDFAYNRQGVTYRIRKKGDAYTATIKTHGTQGTYGSEEKSAKVQNEYDRSFFADPNLILHGQLQTERKEIEMHHRVKVVLDKNTYLGTEDYELEMEYEPFWAPVCNEILFMLIKCLEKESSYTDFYKRMLESKTKSERFFAKKIEKLF